MSTDLETDLRREFDTIRAPSTLTFSPESVLHKGERTIRRRRLIAAGSTAIAVALVAGGATLLTRPHDSAAPLPAAHTATTGIVRAETAPLIWGGQLEVGFDRDTRVGSNVRYSVVGRDGQRHELGVSSTSKPGQEPTATWKSGMVDGHPVTIGVFPGQIFDALTITFANGISYPVGSEELKGTGYMMFYVDYTALAPEGEPRRPSEIASIRWSGPSGAIEGVVGDHRLSGRVFSLSQTLSNRIVAPSQTLSVDVVLRPAGSGRTTVFGQTHLTDSSFWYGYDLSAATTDSSGAAVATGRTATLKTVKGLRIGTAGAPIAAGILPPGSSVIGVVLTTNDAVAGVAVSDRLRDGSVIFAINGDISRSPDPSKDSIKAVTWTNADGTPGRIAVTQKQG
jgi:hypothetical protein